MNEIIEASRDTLPEYITFVGDGEPTLSKDLGWLIAQCKGRLPYRIAVITNGSLLFREEVRDELRQADIVMPSLDAGNEMTFRAVNRPHREIRFGEMLRGQADFRREYKGRLWLEVMLIRNVNDSEAELRSLTEAIKRIGPDKVYLHTPIRPPTESWVERPEAMAILRAQEIIAGAVPVVDLEQGEFDISGFPDARTAILEIGSRHPLRRDQAHNIERLFEETKTVQSMLRERLLVEVDHANQEYLIPAGFKRGKRRVIPKEGVHMNAVSVNADDLEWRPALAYPAGSEEKVLNVGGSTAPRAILLKIPPGWSMDAHCHVHAELHYVLEGEYESLGDKYPAGSFRIIPKEVEHGPFSSKTGAIIMVIMFGMQA